MKEIEYIVGIHHFLNPVPEENKEPAYYLLYLLDEKGLFEYEVARKIYEERFLEAEYENRKAFGKSIGPFSSLEKLNQYAFNLCEELNAARISLLSVQEYNALLENTHSAIDFHRDLVDKGNVIENIERKKKGFLSRFFN